MSAGRAKATFVVSGFARRSTHERLNSRNLTVSPMQLYSIYKTYRLHLILVRATVAIHHDTAMTVVSMPRRSMYRVLIADR